MNMQEAMQILKPADDTLKTLKTAYRMAARKYHPDLNPHGAELMKLVNQAYEVLLKYIGSWGSRNKSNDSNQNMSLDEEIQEILKQVGHLPGLEFEICGRWLWVTGNTYPYRKQLKDAGLFFAPKKKAWFWRPQDSKSNGRGKWSMDKIRTVHGSCPVSTNTVQELGG